MEPAQTVTPTNQTATVEGIGSDDFVVLRNLFDGQDQRPARTLRMMYAKRTYIWKPGQVVNLPGYLGRHFLKHIVKQLYLHVNHKPEMDKRDYPLTDPWVSKVLVKLQHMMPTETKEGDEVVRMPDYDPETDDALISSIKGGGEVELAPQTIDLGDDATDESEERLTRSTPDITPTTIAESKTQDTTTAPPATEPGDEGQDNPPETPFPTVSQQSGGQANS